MLPGQDRDTTNTYRVLLFAQLREAVGQGVVEIRTDRAEITAESLLDCLVAAYPSAAPFHRIVRVASNHTYVERGTIVHPSDEIALITPVSGG